MFTLVPRTITFKNKNNLSQYEVFQKMFEIGYELWPRCVIECFNHSIQVFENYELYNHCKIDGWTEWSKNNQFEVSYSLDIITLEIFYPQSEIKLFNRMQEKIGEIINES